jgi:hypothetical protein
MHVRDTTTIWFSYNIDFARGIGAHVQLPLRIEGQTYGAEAFPRALRQVRIRHDVGSGSGAVWCSSWRAVAVKLHEAELIPDGGFAVPEHMVNKCIPSGHWDNYQEP